MKNVKRLNPVVFGRLNAFGKNADKFITPLQSYLHFIMYDHWLFIYDSQIYS